MLTSADWALIRTAAKARGVKASTAKAWSDPDRRIPAERVPHLSKDTGIPKWKMRPDLYDAPKSASAA